jgi:predicted transcriptional regulator
MRKLFLFWVLIFTFLSPMYALSAEKQEAISSKEIVERLTRLEEGQKAILQRFEDLNKQLDRITAIFTALVVAVIGFAYWDRRTIIKKAKEEAVAHMEKEGKVSDLIKALRELASTDPKLAEVLRKFNLL